MRAQKYMNNASDKFNSQTAPGVWDEELFTPSLTEADDVLGFDCPWNPLSLVMLTFFFGIISGLGLLAFNYKRLGIKGRLYSTLALALFFEILATALNIWAVNSGVLDVQDKTAMQTWRTGTKVVFVGIALLIAQTQNSRFRLFRHSDLPAGKLLKPALLAIAIGFAIDMTEAAFILPQFLKN